MRVFAVVQARMSSKRFPGKVLEKVNGKALLGYLLERLRPCRVDGMVVATSADKSDDAVESYCRENQVSCYRGDLENVASRFAEVIRGYGLDAFVRVNGDSPLIDGRLIDEAAAIFQKNESEIVTNIQRRSFPKGQSVEVFRAASFLENFPLIALPEDREHVTSFFYKNAGRFRIHNFSAPSDYSSFNLSIDTPEDLKAFAGCVEWMNGKPYAEYGWQEILEIYKRVTTREA